VFAYDYFEEQVLCVMDNLNVVYVAFTRARQRIYGWAPKEKINDSGINTMGKLLQVVAAGQHSWQMDTVEDTRSGYDPETLTWTYGLKVPPEQPINGQPVYWMPPLQYHAWQQGLQVRYRALETEESAAVRLPRDQGVLMHDALAKIQQFDEIPIVLKLLQTQGLISDTVAAKMQRQLEAILGQEVFAGWRAGKMKRLAERTLLTGNRELRRPDWVLYNDAETLVIDFKFTEDEKGQAKHTGQVREYMQLLAKAGFNGTKGFLLYGNSLQVVEVSF
jgi:CRISPR/Cas system-associated exonuclease Cas4 (RecB family)